MLIKRGLKK